MENGYGLDSGGNVVIQQVGDSGQGPATRLGGGGGSGFTSFAQAPQAPNADMRGAGESTMRTLEAINKLAQGALGPLLAAEEQRQYYEGMSQVAQGKSLLEIKKDRPWYTEIFGPSATVRGAQAMTLMGTLDTAKADFLSQMPELRKQTPDAVRKYLSDQVRQIGSTGDATMDAMVQAKLAEQWGPMLDLHMKQHVAYVQEQNVTAFGNGLVTAGDSFQQTLGVGSGFYTPEQLKAEQDRATSAFAPIPGMTDEAWATTTTQGLQANLMRGNFGIYEAFKSTPEWQKLPLHARTQLEKMQPYAVQWAQRNAPMFREDASNTAALEVALSQGSGPQSLDALHTYVQQQNEKFMHETGSRSPKFGNDDIAHLDKLWYRGQEFLERQRAAAYAADQKGAAEKADAVAQKEQVLRAVNDGGSAAPVAMNNLSPDIIQQTLLETRVGLEKAGDPAGLNAWLRKLAPAAQFGKKMIDASLSEALTVDANNFFVQGTPVSDQMRRSLSYMQVIASAPNGMAGLAAYVGPENAAKMAFMLKLAPDLADKSAVDAARQAVQAGWDAPVTAADKKAVASYLSDQDPGFIKRNIPLFGPGALSGYELNDDSKARMVADLAPNVARFVRGMGMSHEQAVALAFTQMYGSSSDVDFVDGTYVPGSPVSLGEGLFATVSGRVGGMSQLSEDYQKALRNVLNTNMGKQIGKVVLEPSKVPTIMDRTASLAAKVAEGVAAYVPPVGLVGYTRPGPLLPNSPEAFAPDLNTFDPNDYKTVSGMATGAGIVFMTRVPKRNDAGLRPVTVMITADQVLAELDAIRRNRIPQFTPWPTSEQVQKEMEAVRNEKAGHRLTRREKPWESFIQAAKDGQGD
ncbi:hypothetical protein [Achromobacter xylosoxidans]|uniref:hypothetical protein n=1 Tax=Alcaligenes xylosoxydans xylosoxydans TaxID=85698 RepID=UPI001564A9C1|nr:hypothetical protein [Achromobacter xylosoxidans]QKI69216.1 hypothetical protein HPS44_06035 [Achromobacter xylosoxidans]